MKTEKTNPLSTDLSVPWPKPDDVLIRSDGDWPTAFLRYDHARWQLYAKGYKEAADAVAERIFETNQGMDYLIYPIAFLYRHCLELQMKEIIVAGRELLGTPNLQTTHDLEKLWSSCRQVLEKDCPGQSKEQLESITNCVQQLCLVDANSQAFRYPHTKTGERSLETLTHVSIRNLYAVMQRVFSFLDCASTYLQQRRDPLHGNKIGPSCPGYTIDHPLAIRNQQSNA